MKPDVTIKIGCDFFQFLCTGKNILDMKFISNKVEYVTKFLLGYFTPINGSPIIGVSGIQGEKYNARLLSHEFLHYLLHYEIDFNTNLQFDNIAYPPLTADGLGGSMISLTKDELHQRFKDGVEEVKK